MRTNCLYFSQFLDMNFEYYISMKTKSLDLKNQICVPGDHLDIQAICEIFDVQVSIWNQLQPIKQTPTATFYSSLVKQKHKNKSYVPISTFYFCIFILFCLFLLLVS
jgi:hypothetical protein